MTQEIVRQEDVGKLTRNYEFSVEQVIAQVQKIQQVMQKVMKADEHYGVVPGTHKPTLLKPGAEKLAFTFRLDPQYEVLATSVQREDFISYAIRCTLYHIPTGDRIASGMGSCNSREAKYRYREGKRKCPNCDQETIIKGKEEFGGGWICFTKKGGCGAKWPDEAPEITSQKVGQVENENPWDLDNTLLKMASKRALVAAVLNGTAASDIFTQDLEDMEIPITSEKKPQPASKADAEPAQTDEASHPACPKCGGTTKLVRAGINKKTGGKYPAFYSCRDRKCGGTVKIEDSEKPAMPMPETLPPPTPSQPDKLPAQFFHGHSNDVKKAIQDATPLQRTRLYEMAESGLLDEMAKNFILDMLQTGLTEASAAMIIDRAEKKYFAEAK